MFTLLLPATINELEKKNKKIVSKSCLITKEKRREGKWKEENEKSSLETLKCVNI